MIINMADGNSIDDNEESGENSQQSPVEQGQISDADIESMVQECSHEYSDLLNTMDQINDWMNDIERKNDTLQSQLKELLESNREVRKEIQASEQSESSNSQPENNPPDISMKDDATEER
ncbi:hypothetical protein CHS0354_000909 [Potamilus streckersoni]|uniref:Uncharacterized protein n=1 Tax=Potamilus streckersoni TaxID=2493646 RepID=A0AAE0VRE7_9BIVA|nr:hypothetical protein CHS0354_000909 [Potamilus streckersoni]